MPISMAAEIMADVLEAERLGERVEKVIQRAATQARQTSRLNEIYAAVWRNQSSILETIARQMEGSMKEEYQTACVIIATNVVRSHIKLFKSVERVMQT